MIDRRQRRRRRFCQWVAAMLFVTPISGSLLASGQDRSDKSLTSGRHVPTDLALAEVVPLPKATSSLIAFTALVDENWDIVTWDLNPAHAPIQRTKTPFDETTPSLSYDHSFCIYGTVDGRLWRVDLNAQSQPTPLPFAGDQHFDMHASVSPDSIAVVLATSLDRSTDDTDLIVYDVVTKSFRRRLELMSFQHEPTWAPDGRHVAFAHLQGRLQTGKPISEIWGMRTDAPWARQFTLLDAFSISPSWSSDGKRIVFSSNRSSQFDLWMVNPVTRAVRRLTKHEAADTDPVFAPDNQSVLFVSTRGGRLGLWRHDLSSSVDRAISPFGPESTILCKDPDWK